MKEDEPQVGKRHEDVKGNENATILLFSMTGLEILHQERRGQVKTIVMEYFNGILLHKSKTPGLTLCSSKQTINTHL